MSLKLSMSFRKVHHAVWDALPTRYYVFQWIHIMFSCCFLYILLFYRDNGTNIHKVPVVWCMYMDYIYILRVLCIHEQFFFYICANVNKKVANVIHSQS